MAGGRWASINMIRPLSQPVGSPPPLRPPTGSRELTAQRILWVTLPQDTAWACGRHRAVTAAPAWAGGGPCCSACAPDSSQTQAQLLPPRGVRVTAERCHLAVTCSLDKTMERTQVYRHALWTNISDLSTQPPSSGKSEHGRDARQMKADHLSEGAATSTGFSLDEARRSLRCLGLRPGA